MPYRPVNKYPRSDKLCTVYILHFSEPFKHARHYIGVVKDLERLPDRINEHRAGNGSASRLCAAAVASGIKLMLTGVWVDVPRYTEIYFKNRGGGSRVCPLCRVMRAAETGKPLQIVRLPSPPK